MKRIISLLICICMVLTMLPAISVSGFEAKAAEASSYTDYQKKLEFGEDGKTAYCAACKKPVVWTAFSGNSAGTLALGTKNNGEHYHIYLSADVNARGIANAFLNLQSNTNMCLHLNGYNIVHGGYIFVAASTLNIMGTGDVTFTATNTSNTYDQAALYANASGIINLYGGNYSVAEDALAEGKPIMKLALSGSQANVENATVSGQTIVTNGVLTLAGTTNFDNILVETGGKLFVKNSWTGNAKVSFAAALQNNVVPAANGGCDSAFAGTLNMADGVTLQGAADGTLTASGFNANLVLDENSQGYCAVCDATVTWTAINNGGRMGALAANGKYHFYLAENVTAMNAQFCEIYKSTACLHLNGRDLTYKGRMQVASEATTVLNILGSGNVTFTGDVTASNATTQANYRVAGINMAGANATVNLYGGTYSTAGQALTDGVPMVWLNATVNLNLYNTATIDSELRVSKGVLTIYDNAGAANLTVGTAGKLVVADGWSGAANVSFAAGFVDGKVPAANGVAAGAFTGTLKLPDGNKLQAGQGNALCLVSMNSNLVLDANSQAECPICAETVTWTPLNNGQRVGYKKGDQHLHYYLSEDMKALAGAQFMELEGGTKVCLHLNGHDLTLTGQNRISTAAALNIMGNGNVDFTATASKDIYNYAAIYTTGGAVSLYGGTYTVSGTAAESGKPVVSLTSSTEAQVTINGATIKGLTSVASGNLTLCGETVAEQIYVGESGKLTVNENWSGTAQAEFAVMLQDNRVPAEFAVAEGMFTGTLTMADGSQLLPQDDGTLTREIVLQLDENSQAYCQVCNALVTWTELKNGQRIGYKGEECHMHYYVGADMTSAAGAQFMEIEKGTKVCLHLNGKNLTVPGQSRVGIDSELYVMGTGSFNFLGTANGDNYNQAAIYVGGGAAYLLGGTYSVSGAAAEAGRPTVLIKDAQASQLVLSDVTICGSVKIDVANIELQGNTNIDRLFVGNSAKLTVDSIWSGVAEVEFAAGLIDGEVKASCGVSTGDFVGGLKMQDGTILVAKDGKLVAGTDEYLRLTEDNKGFCRACGKMVKWKALHNGERIGTDMLGTEANYHYYFADDDMTATSGVMFANINKKNTLCLHLNGKSVTLHGGFVFSSGTLNILGDGKVHFLGNSSSASSDTALIYSDGWSERRLNIYGGTFTVASGKQALMANGRNYTTNMIVKLYGNTNLDGLVYLNQAQFHMNDSVKVKFIEATNTGSIRVYENWKGAATVDYFTQLTGDYISEYSGRSEGSFIGGLMLADGRRLVGENGKLRITEAGSLMLNAQKEGYCEACNEVVTWTPVEGNRRIDFFSDGVHRHYYLSGDLNMPDTLTQVLGVQNTSFCLHLNGNNMTHGGRIFATGKDSVLSIMGSGNVTFTASSAAGGDEYRVAGIKCIESQLRLLGGTYSVAGKALEQNKPTISSDGNTYIKNAVINGWVEASGKSVTLDGTITAHKIVVAANGKLELSDTWTGAANVTFANPYVGNALPVGNFTGDAYTGKLTLVDGRTVIGNTITGAAVNENISYKTTEDGAELVSYTGEGDFLVPATIAGLPVTSIADDAFANFNGKLFIGKNNAVALAYAQEKNLAYTEVSTYTLDNGAIQLQTNADTLTFDKDTYLDLNGYNVANVTVTAGTLFVLDSQTDDYSVADGVYGNIVNSTGDVQAANGYLKVTQGEGTSFHCLTLNIDAMTLRPDVAGVYYNSTIAGDEVVAAQVQTFGVALSLSEDMRNSGYSVYHNFTAGATSNAKGTLLKNVMKTDLTDAKNGQRAQMPVYGRAYIKTADGYIFGETVQRCLQEQVELADEAFETLTKVQKEEAKKILDTYQSVMEKWDLSNIGNYKDRLWFDAPAPDTGDGWEQYSLPLGNGYMGVSVFGGTESELLSISDKTMFNPTITNQSGAPSEGPDGEDVMQYGQGGLTNMCKAYIDFDHNFTDVTDYERDLVLETAQAHVSYDYDGVTYNRTYFTSYPDNVMVMKLDASQTGKLTFTLRPVATYVRDYCILEGDGAGKTGTVTASGDTSIVAGTLKAYQINYEAQFKVIPVGGTMVANSDGTITVENADSAVILMSVGTNYELKPETLTASNKNKLDPNKFPHDDVTAVINAAATKTYEQLLQTHLEDYQGLYGRVEVDLGGMPSTDMPTDKMMQAYRAGDFDAYLEQLLFQYGRYLLIASSRSGTLPANLQGVWQYYPAAAWDGQYVYNINLQMNYWSAFATNLAELFEPNIEFFDAIWPTLQSNADKFLTGVKSPYKAESGIGANGIAVGSTGTPYRTPTVSASVSMHTGPGSTGYTSDLFWHYYQFTKNEAALERVYPYLEGAATFLSKTLEDYDGKWLVSHSASPENNLYMDDSIQTVGTMFDQAMVRESFVQALEAARLLKYTSADSPILDVITEKLNKLDPVNIGKDGHVKEYREEEYYGEYGLYEHHGMGQLVGVYPGTTITSKTDAWQDAAAVTAIERGINYTGHQASFKQLVWARLGDAANSYLLAQEHIVKYLRDNLWNTHTPFQIDGNFGYTAGVAEMLIQSHEGFIKVLPALPEQWDTGYYKGLTARGGFEVDVAWEDGNATEIVITSNAGEPCSLHHFRASNATVTDSKGNPVNFTVDNADQITFATTEGETYTITGLAAKPEVETPADLTITDGFNLSWKASKDAVSYKVYRAVNSQATYDLIAENVTGTTYSYNPTDLNAGDQVTIRITAVNADGVESDGIRTITWLENQSE